MRDDVARLLRQVHQLWIKQIELCKEAKERDFGAAAREVMRYVGKKYRRVMLEPKIDATAEGAATADPQYVAVYNMTQAFIDVMVPYVFAQVPDFLASPRRPQMPPELAALMPDVAQGQDAVRARDAMTCYLLQWLLNYCPKLYDLEREGRMVVEEALGKGRGTFWIEMEDSPTGEIPAAYAESVDRLLIDADCRQLRDAGYIVREYEESIYRIAERFDEDPEKLRAHATTNLGAAIQGHIPDESSQQLKPDVGRYYRVWSRIGLGHKLVGAASELKRGGKFFEAVEALGPYVCFCVMEGMDRPLGMDPAKILARAGIPVAEDRDEPVADARPQPVAVENPQEVLLAVLRELLKWPIETYGNPSNPWPMRCVDPKPRLDKPWPKPILESALPLQEFLDRVYRTMMTRVDAAGRDICVTSAALEEAIRTALASTDDLPIVPVGDDVDKETLAKLVNFIQFPSMNRDILQVLAVVDKAFREMTGMDESQFGVNPRTQERSAAATNARAAGLARRPDDYADRVEAALGDTGALVAIAARLMVSHETVAPMLGEPILQDPQTGQPIYGVLTQAWIQFVQTDDPWTAAAEHAYTVAAGSGRRRNRQLYQDNAQQMWQMFGNQAFTVSMQTGDMQPYVELATLVGDAFQMPIQSYLNAFVRAAQMAFMQGQAAMAAAQGQSPDGSPKIPKGAEPESPAGAGITPAEGGLDMPGGQSMATRWLQASTTPSPRAIAAPPQYAV